MTSPLTLVMPLEENVDLAKLAETLGQAAGAIDAALTSIATVHFARFVLFDTSTPNMQPGSTTGPFKLAVITEYDNDFDSYIQQFVDNIGDVFNALLAFTADGQSLIKVQNNVAAFAEYVAKNDASQHLPRGIQPLYCAYDATVQTILASLPPEADTS